MAAVLPRMKPAFKVAGDGRMSYNGAGRFTGVIIDELEPSNPWRKYQLKLLPKKINGKWYKPGDWVYRRRAISPGGGFWVYGDDFDFMRGC